MEGERHEKTVKELQADLAKLEAELAIARLKPPAIEYKVATIQKRIEAAKNK